MAVCSTRMLLDSVKARRYCSVPEPFSRVTQGSFPSRLAEKPGTRWAIWGAAYLASVVAGVIIERYRRRADSCPAE